MKNKQKSEKNAKSTIFFTSLLQQTLSNRLLQLVIDDKKNNYSDVFKQKTRSGLKLRICCEKYCEYCTSKK